MIDTNDLRRRRLKRSDRPHYVSGHPGCTVAEASAALPDPASTAVTNRELLHDLYRARWLDPGRATGGGTTLTARRPRRTTATARPRRAGAFPRHRPRSAPMSRTSSTTPGNRPPAPPITSSAASAATSPKGG